MTFWPGPSYGHHRLRRRYLRIETLFRLYRTLYRRIGAGDIRWKKGRFTTWADISEDTLIGFTRFVDELYTRRRRVGITDAMLAGD